jgi:adenylate cyclase
VLPFANLSDDPEQEYFVDAITDDLTTDLSRISGSFVIARSTSFIYKNKAADVRQVGRELGVRYILEGSARRNSDQVRVNVQLVDAESGAHLWADRFDTDRTNLAEAQNEITGRIARTLSLALVEDVSRRIDRERTVDPGAHDLVMRGWAWFYRSLSAENRMKAWQAFEQALQIDRESVEARIGLAMILVTNVAVHWSTSANQDEQRAEQFLQEALERDANRSMAHYAMGIVRRLQSRLAEAQTELETAIALDPNNASALHQLAVTLMWLGQPQAAITHVQKGIRLSPHDPEIQFAYSVLGMCYLLLGQVEHAIYPMRKARAANPRLYYTHMNLAAALGLKGEVDEASAALAESVKIRPEFNSLARLHLALPWTRNPHYMALAENTFEAGLRRAGFPE